MCILRLRLLLANVLIRTRRQILRAQLSNKFARISNRIRTNTRRVGTHIGDQTDRTLRADLHTLIQTLRHAHRAAHIESQPASRILLQFAGRIRSLRIIPALLLLHRTHAPLRMLQFADHLIDSLFIRQRIRQIKLFAIFILTVRHPRWRSVDADKPCDEALLLLCRSRLQRRINRPILHRIEVVDLLLALDDQPQRNGLHTSGRKPTPYLVPQQRRYLISHQPVQHPSRLLRVHKVFIHITSLQKRSLHSLLRNLVERHPTNLRFVLHHRKQLNRKMRGDCLPFAIRVRREVDHVCLRRQLLQPLYNLLFSGRHNQRRLKRPILQLHSDIVLRQVHDVANRSLHHVVVPEIFSDRLRLCRRFHDHK